MTTPSESSPAPLPAPGLSSQPPLPALGLLAVLCYVFLVGVPLLRGVPPWAAVLPASLVFAGLSMTLVGLGATPRLSLAVEGILAIVSMAVWFGADGLAERSDAGRLYLGPLGTVAFLLTCLLVGRLLSRIVREPALVLPVCLVAALGDVFTVFFGPTGQALDKAPALVKKLSLAIPAAGSAVGPAGVKGLAFVATMGLGDFIFLALFLALAVRFGFRVQRSLWATVAGAGVGITLALTVRAVAGMPLLPYMCAGFLVANWREFRLSPREKRDMAIGLAILVALFVAAALALRG